MHSKDNPFCPWNTPPEVIVAKSIQASPCTCSYAPAVVGSRMRVVAPCDTPARYEFHPVSVSISVGRTGPDLSTVREDGRAMAKREMHAILQTIRLKRRSSLPVSLELYRDLADVAIKVEDDEAAR